MIPTNICPKYRPNDFCVVVVVVVVGFGVRGGGEGIHQSQIWGFRRFTDKRTNEVD